MKVQVNSYENSNRNIVNGNSLAQTVATHDDDDASKTPFGQVYVYKKSTSRSEFRFLSGKCR